MKKYFNIIKNIIIILIVVGLGYLGYRFYKEKTKPPLPSEVLELTEVLTGEVSEKISATANVKANNEINLFISTAQSVSKINVKVGDYVNSGDVLIEYDISQDKKDLEKKLQEAQLNLQNSKLALEDILKPAEKNEILQYENDILTADKNITDIYNDIESLNIKITQQKIKIEDAENTVLKNSTLLSQGVIAKSELENAELNLKTLNESLKDLETQLDAKNKSIEIRENQKKYAEEKLENSKNKSTESSNLIKYSQQENIIQLNELEVSKIQDDINKLVNNSITDISGSVTEINIAEGEVVSKGVPLIIISDISNAIAKSEISEYDAPLVELNQIVNIYTSALPDKIYKGTVTKIASEAIKKENSSDDEVVVLVEITINDIDEKLKVGYTVDVDIFIEQKENVINIPIQSLLEIDGEFFVYILDGEKVTRKKITTGLMGDKNIEIIEGLKSGDKIISSPVEGEKYYK